MTRILPAVVSLVLSAGVTAARDQVADETKKLKEQIALLEGKLKAAETEIESLKKRLEQARGGGAKPLAEGAKPSLSEMLAEGAILKGDYKWTNRKLSEGDCTLTITSRDGRKFKGTHVAAPKNDGPKVEREVEGSIDGTRITYRSVNTADKFTITGSLKGESIELQYVSQDGGQAKGTLKVSK